ncbi:hypothetical protein GCK72_008967 [Caenorhabditis remanei]|uniref:Uncharacterized protein n=1 Tax=Caenorhabditis remanei TaxID=31234 RepID=A0A6A5GZ04_CAERE|nr:hypothetical protein GCK72_008967 [Caenorhabditis remanei]KAF1760718.1 hypothetical protein GCK72_008967 [Caenorhabditis remanei]
MTFLSLFAVPYAVNYFTKVMNYTLYVFFTILTLFARELNEFFWFIKILESMLVFQYSIGYLQGAAVNYLNPEDYTHEYMFYTVYFGLILHFVLLIICDWENTNGPEIVKKLIGRFRSARSEQGDEQVFNNIS